VTSGRNLLLIPVAVYLLWAALFIAMNPGFQYDEALLVLGGVHMRHSWDPFPLPQDPGTWICPMAKCVQLMTVRYVGAIKDYLSLPLFALFGTGAEVVRALSAALGALGIWGLGRLIFAQAGRNAGLAVAGVLAMHPAYVDQTVFDNGTVSVWMGALGVVCLALNRYLETGRGQPAFLLGAALGFGIWARANFLWLIMACAAALAIVLGRRVFVGWRHFSLMAAGGVAGGVPFLLYQVVSGGGTLEAAGMFASTEPLLQRHSARLWMFTEVLLTDREHRAIWDGPMVPEWQRWLFPAILAAAALACAVGRPGLEGKRLACARAACLAMLMVLTTMLFTRLPVSEHHLIVLVPLAVLVVVIGLSGAGKKLAYVLGIVYFASALWWQALAVEGLHRTGGVGQWSDAVFGLADFLEEKYNGREIKILDWGLQNNLYVLTDGRIRSREIYGDVGAEAWPALVRNGGVFLFNGPANRHFPEATERFQTALQAAGAVSRRYAVRQRSGAVYAEIVEVEPLQMAPQ